MRHSSALNATQSKFISTLFMGMCCLCRRYRALNVQAGTQLCDGKFQREVATGKLSSSSLNDYTCIALAGVATEYLRFGRSEGGNNDVLQLDAMLKGLRVRIFRQRYIGPILNVQ